MSPLSPEEYAKGQEPVTIEGAEAYGETAAAIQVKVPCEVDMEHPNGWRFGIWIPKSQIHDDSEVYGNGHKGKLVIPTWLAISKNLA